jgi:hypothetical protein
MFTQKILNHSINRDNNNNDTNIPDSFFLWVAYLSVALLEVVLYPIWRPIYWLIKRK